jgi:thiol-disulfide isomerase/thioredoxin
MKILYILLIGIFVSHTCTKAQVYIDVFEEETLKTNNPNSIYLNNVDASSDSEINRYIDSLLENNKLQNIKYDTINQKIDTNKIDIYINVDTLIDAKKTDIIQPITIVNKPLKTFTDLDLNSFYKYIDSTGQKYYIQFTADWCGPCKMMDKDVFSKQSIIDISNTDYIAKKIDIDDFDGIQITQDLKIKSIPATIIFDCHGRELKRIEGFQYEDMFLYELKKYR